MATDSLRQRLVGGAALLVIGIVAWFWLLSADSPVDPVARESQIPPAPAQQIYTVPEPVAPTDVVPAEQPGAAPVEEQPAPVPIAPAQPQPESKPTVAKPSTAKPVAPASTSQAAAPKVVVKSHSETFELDRQGLPEAWVVQAGVYSSQANAERIKGALQQKGFKAYTQSIKTANGAVVKVFVGPKLSRERAEAQRQAIDKALRVHSLVVRFTAS